VGAFADSPVTPYLGLNENTVLKGRYEVSESRSVWDDGFYNVLIYKQNGSSPAPGADTVIGSARFYVQNDLETTERNIADQTDRLLFDGDGNVKSTRTYEEGAVVEDEENSHYSVTTDLAETIDDYWLGAYVKFTTGAVNGQVKKIKSFNATTKVLAFTAPLTETPAAGDVFKIINE
jgi:hypothetical protein